MEAFIQWPAIQNLEMEKREMEMRLTAQPLIHNIETSKELERVGLNLNQIPIHQIQLPVAMETFSLKWMKTILPFKVKRKQLLFSTKVRAQFYQIPIPLIHC